MTEINDAWFDAEVQEIEMAVARGSSDGGIKRRVTKLMGTLLQHPSIFTVGYFIEIHERWGSLVDAVNILQRRWSKWVDLNDALQLLAYKYRNNPLAMDLLVLIDTTDSEILHATSRLGLGGQVGMMIQTVLEKSYHHYTLYKDLTSVLMDERFREITSVQAYLKRFEARQPRPRIRRVSLDPGTFTVD